eukprot:10003581-Heterocapsa_arctica.AAC.1
MATYPDGPIIAHADITAAQAAVSLRLATHALPLLAPWRLLNQRWAAGWSAQHHIQKMITT